MKRTVATFFVLMSVVPRIAIADLPLFASTDDLDIVIEAPMRTLVRNKDDRPEVEGTIQYTDANGEHVSIGMTLTSRGHSRLLYCSFPPLSLNLKRKQTKGTLFEGQNKLKIVTHCKNGSLHERYLQQEFGIYRAFNVLTDESFRVRWLNVTYRDTDDENKEDLRTAFFIESDGEVATRAGLEKLKPDQIEPEQLDPVYANRYSVFQLMIANTDWSMRKGPSGDGCCHNGKVLIEPGSTSGWIVLPYDFDQAGLIYTRYSVPADALGIRTVKQRLFRGRCSNLEALDDTIAAFNENRPAIEGALQSKVEKSSARKSMTKYVDDFYDIINDPKKRQRQITDDCLGK